MAVPTKITDLSTTAASNSPAGSDSIGNPGQIDDYFRGYGAVQRAESLNKSWERWNDTPTYISATQFSVATDLTARYTVDRRVKCTVTAGTVYGYISASAFGSVTTVTVVLDSGSLDSGLSEVQLGPENNAVLKNTRLTTPTVLTSVTLPLGSISTSQWLAGTALGHSRRIEVRLASGSGSGAVIGTNDYDTGTSTGSSFFIDFTASSGNTSTKLNALTAAGSAAGDLILQNAFAGSRVGIGMVPARTLDITGTFGATGAATFGSTINKVTVTAPATGSTLTIADGKTLTASNTVTVTATDGATIAAGGGISASTYTPTLTSVSNVSASTARVCQYMRIGSVVTVSGAISVTATAGTTLTAIGISLPIASNLTAANQCAGSGGYSGLTAIGHAIVAGDSANDRAELDYISPAADAREIYFTFTYTIA